jgi:carboxyl-terminal processing protease
MWRKIKWPLFISLMIAAGFAFRSPAEKYFEIAKSLDIFATLFKEVNAYYVDEVEPQKLIRKGIDGMLESLDPYTTYIPEDELETFRISTTGQYGGIGALIGIVNKKTVITHPYKDYPAYKAGLKVGDELIAINGKNVKGDQTSDVSLLLKGQPKTEVEVKIKRYGQKDDLTFKIKREKISLSNVAYYGMIENDIAYIKLDDFTSGASKEVANALSELKQKGAKKLILDLRDNPGGLLHEAVNIVSLFIPKGQPVVSTKGKVEEWNKTYSTLNAPVDTEIPIVVLTSEGSASASEIVAGSLQDYDRAVLMGTRTFGKGLVQTTRSLSYNTQLKVTTAKYFIPSGRCIQELDYAHRKADGTVDKFADSLKAEFKTKCGRKVFDGGGLDPDVKVEEEYLGAVTAALINSGLLFDYASKFCAENPGPHDLKQFKISDKEYDKFDAWIREQNFNYSTLLEKETEELTKIASQEKYYPEIENQLKDLKKRIEASKRNDLVNYKNEISEILEEQIAFHYALAEGQAAVSLDRDKTISEARRVLDNTGEYKKILSVE